MNKCNLSAFGMGMSFGLVWGVSVLLTGLSAYFLSYGKPFVMLLGSIYVGYEPSVIGSIIGGVFGFIDGFIGGYLIAAIYNVFSKGCRCCEKDCQPK